MEYRFGSGFAASGSTEAAVAHIQIVFSQIVLVAVMAQQIAKAYGEFERRSATLSRSATSLEEEPGPNAQRDMEMLNSLPCIGRIVIATLLAEARDPLRWRDHQAPRCLSDVAPVTKVVRPIRHPPSPAHNRLQDAVYHRGGGPYSALKVRLGPYCHFDGSLPERTRP